MLLRLDTIPLGTLNLQIIYVKNASTKSFIFYVFFKGIYIHILDNLLIITKIALYTIL